jgi:pyruvate-ferredoxin/flavodoxin oxidoreductase
VQEQDADVLGALQQRFGFMGATPNTPTRFTEGSDTPDGDIKRLMLDHDNFYATTGGHGGCRGCGEVTAIRLVMSTSHAISERHRREHLKALTGLVDRLYAKRATVADPARQERLTRTITTLERRLYEQEGGPTGNGPASTIIANSTGCSSVYASTMPFNNYLDPWVNSLFQDAQPLAKGIFEGVAAQSVADVRALRVAELELSDSYEPEVHDKALSTLSWEGYSPQEMELLPTILTIGGDGATYDIGFGAMSRILASDTPVKVLVLNSGVYSNTGGQASTASLTGQDSDLERFGSAHDGKHESRKELGLLASFHPNVYVCSTSTAIQGHFLTSTMEFLRYQDAAAVLDVYTPCGSEHGIPEEASSRRARLAVESRMNPVFVHDPRRGSTLHDWFSLDGNPDIAKTWTNTDLAYRDDAGELQLMTLPLTPAEFALGETRFRKQFKRLPADLDGVAVRMDEYVELGRDEQAARVPFVYATDEHQKLIKVQCSDSIVALVKDRRRYWQILQYLSGAHEAKLTSLHRSDLADLRSRYEEAMRERESSIDSIAEAMSSLATTSRAPVGAGSGAAGRAGRARMPAAPPAASPSPGAVGTVGAVGAAPPDSPVHLAEVDIPKCNDCGTCYQELPQLFEPHSMLVDGAVQKVARMIPGALETVELTPELLKRIDRVKKTCDAEIIQ